MIRTGELARVSWMNAALNWRVSKKAQRQLTDKVKSALRYPIIILAMAIMVVVAMLHFVLRSLPLSMTFNTPLPALTQGIMTLADLVANGAGCWCCSAFCWR